MTMSVARCRRTVAAAIAVLGVGVLSACDATSEESAAEAAGTPSPVTEQGDASEESDGMDMESGQMAMGMQSLGTQSWEGMRVELASMMPSSFTVFEGTDTEEVTPAADENLHLMAVLSDEQSGERIPYASCWVTVRDQSGEIVVDERLWPMLSREMGTHYGINVALPEAGTYDVELRVDPPQAARHPEYADVWMESTSFEFEMEFDG